MRISKSKSRIIGVQLGEATINRINPGVPALVATFALVREDGELAGRIDRRMEWPEKVVAALSNLQDALEEAAIDHLFEPQPPADAAAAEPSQI